MRFLIQRVNQAKVTVEEKVTGEIQKGFVVFLGISENDTQEIADKLVKKLLNLRIFEDSEGKTNLALKDVGGSLLLVSQFTLYADCKKRNRPTFIRAASPDLANKLYEYIIQQCRAAGFQTETGIFGADMTVQIENNGPFTIILDSTEIC